MTEERSIEIPKVTDSIDAIPEPLRDFYVEKDGRYMLEDPKSLRGAKKHAFDEMQKFKKQAQQVDRWERLGKTPEEIEELLLNADNKGNNGDDTSKLIPQLKSQYEKKLSDLQKELEAERTAARNTFIEGKLTAALDGKKDDAGNWLAPAATSEGKYFLKKELANRVRYEARDGKQIYRVMQDDGETPMAGSDPNGMATFEDLVREAAMKFPSLFQGTGHGGSGASGGRPGSAATAKPRSKMSFEEKARYIESYGHEAYQKLPV